MVAIEMFVTDLTRWHHRDGMPSKSAYAHKGTSTVTASSVFTVGKTALRKCADIVNRHANITLSCDRSNSSISILVWWL